MEADLRALLLAGLSGMTVDRINWGESPQEITTDYIVLHLVSFQEGRTQQGPDGLEISRVQIDCYARSLGGARGMARSVQRALDFYRGGGFLGIFLDALRLPREDPTHREGGRDAGQPLYHASLDFIVNWRSQNA